MTILRIFQQPASALAVLLLLGLPAHAHDYHAVLSSIDYNADTATLEVIHEIFGHDMVAVLAALDGRDIDPDGAAFEPKVRAYVESRFTITADGVKLPLGWVGLSLEGDHLITYQEAPLRVAPATLHVVNILLLDGFGEERNLVDIHIAGKSLRGEFHDQRTAADFQLGD